MKTMVCATMIVMMLLAPLAVQGDDEVQALRAYYEKAITQEISACLKKSALRSSRSLNLRMKGHREASKALFLQTNREALVDSMLALQLAPADYKVERFLNDRFRCTCYAQWAGQDHP